MSRYRRRRQHRAFMRKGKKMVRKIKRGHFALYGRKRK